MSQLLQRVRGFDSHHRFVIAIATAGLAVLATPGLRLGVRGLIAWDAFAFASLALSWFALVFTDARSSVREARLQDSSRTVLFLFVLIAVLVSLAAVISLLGGVKDLAPAIRAKHAALAGLTVALSWCLTHTVFAIRYAHSYYHLEDEEPDREDGDGLSFPGDERPGFLDFAYFSFVIGMTFQVSDVTITSPGLRRLVLLQSLLAFGFNTVILALSVNLASSFL